LGFYELPKPEREVLIDKINQEITKDLVEGEVNRILEYFSDEDTYIRKGAYLAIGKIFKQDVTLHSSILKTLKTLFQSEVEKVRQTTVNAAGEIGKLEFGLVESFFDQALFDSHHSVRNAVIGSIKKMSEKNPEPTLKWARQYLHHQEKEIRREICHGIELRGRTHPQDILPMLEELHNDETARVRNTLVHVVGQIAYKKGCLETVIKALNQWENKEVVEKAIDEIVDVHERYRDFAYLTQHQAIEYIEKHHKKE